jgi:hypothetical protein
VDEKDTRRAEDAVRLAAMRVPGTADPALAYGCVDWFRYPALRSEPERSAAGDDARIRRPGDERGGVTSRPTMRRNRGNSA